jgi:hypothetical protein
VTRAAVCQYLAIVKRLPAEAVRTLEAESDPARLRELSMKSLVRIARMSGDDETRWAALEAVFGPDIANQRDRRKACAR